MDRSRRHPRRQDREDSPPPPPPVAPPPMQMPQMQIPQMQMPQIPTDPTQMFGLMRDMVVMMQATQQQIQTQQQMMLQQQQQFVQQFAQAPRAEPVVAPREAPNDRVVKFPEFIRMVPEFYGSKTNPAAAETWIEELEKAFDACHISEDRKVSLAIYQLKDNAYNWWREARGKIQGPLTWDMFRGVFFHEYFTDSAREKMVSDWLKLRQDNKTVDEYEAEFNRLLRFTGIGYRDDERMKIQKFQDGLNPELSHAVKTFELGTLSQVAHKAKVIEQSKKDCNAQLAKQNNYLG